MFPRGRRVGLVRASPGERRGAENAHSRPKSGVCESRLGRVRKHRQWSAEHSNGPWAPGALGYARTRSKMSTSARPRYEPREVEAAPPAGVAQSDASATPPLSDDTPHIYIKPSAPFTSGNIHIGHVRSYSIGDAYARFRRARGDDVLFSFGFDAFGLPAELAAITSGEPPSGWVDRCAEHMRGQLERLGFSFDWERSFMSSDPGMYRWSQWLFLELLEAGLIYRGTGSVDWCDNCQTTLASIQVEAGGTCWRCHEPVQADRDCPSGTWGSARTCPRTTAVWPSSGGRDLGRGGACLPADRARARRRRRARAARPRGRAAGAVHPLPRRARAGALRADQPTPPGGRELGVRRGRGRAAGAAPLRGLGAQRARGRDDPGDRHRPCPHRPRGPGAAGC